jgi:amino acid permease
MPDILKIFMDESKIPSFMGDTAWGRRFWGTFYTYLVLFPMSLPRKVNKLNYASALGVFCAIYFGFAITMIFWVDRDLVPHPFDNIKDADFFKASPNGVFSTIPLIIFAYMYQINMPIIYAELKNQSYQTMNTVVKRGTNIVVVMYLLTGIFGYLTFMRTP